MKGHNQIILVEPTSTRSKSLFWLWMMKVSKIKIGADKHIKRYPRKGAFYVFKHSRKHMGVNNKFLLNGNINILDSE